MGYIVLARKYRPKTFDEVVGQPTVARTLRNSIEMDRIPHACLFSGPRGVGKTTMARIFAKALDCEKGPSTEPCNECDICVSISGGDDVDVVEIDGASNNSVENIRDLRENAQFTASRTRFKVYIIDEVHMLTKSAFNALLKILEEPPAHVKFIFATTELDRIPDTVQSRCQRFDFVPLKTPQMVERLTMICGLEKANAEDGVLEKIAEHAEGSMRDAESALDQLISLGGGELRMQDVNDVLGTASDEDVFGAISAALSGDAAKTLSTLNSMIEKGSDPQMVAAQLAGIARDLAVMKTCGQDSQLVRRVDSIRSSMFEFAGSMPEDALLYAAKLLCDAERQMAWSPNPSIVLEMSLLKLKDAAEMGTVAELIQKLERLSGGDVKPPVPVRRPAPRPERDAAATDIARERPAEPKVTQERKRVPQKAPAGTDTTIVRGSWKDVITRLKDVKQATAAFLKEAEPMRFDAGKLIVGIHSGYKIHKEHLEEFENRQLVEDIVEDVLGIRYEIQYVSLGEDAKKEEPNTEEGKPSSLKEDPAVKKAAEVFNATIVSVKGP